MVHPFDSGIPRSNLDAVTPERLPTLAHEAWREDPGSIAVGGKSGAGRKDRMEHCVMRLRSGERPEAAERERADPERRTSDRHLAPQSAHVAHVLLFVLLGNHGTAA